MLIILSQKIDTESEYADETFRTYHYPARYKNQIHEGDTFVYYQGNRYVKEQRYYFGAGTIGSISTPNGVDYYATLLKGRRFEKKVSIYFSNGGYVETLGYDTVRKSPTPPWQSSVRPLSQQAYDYILSESGILEAERQSSIDKLKEDLKSSIRDFFLEKQDNAITRIKSIASEIIEISGIPEALPVVQQVSASEKPRGDADKLQNFIMYCETTHLTYSYKPVLILAFLECANDQGIMRMTDGIRWVREYYRHRRDGNLVPEKKKSICQKPDITDDEIRQNLTANPIKALTGSGYFHFDKDKQEFSILPELWYSIGHVERSYIEEVCKKRLEQYYST